MKRTSKVSSKTKPTKEKRIPIKCNRKRLSKDKYTLKPMKKSSNYNTKEVITRKHAVLTAKTLLLGELR